MKNKIALKIITTTSCVALAIGAVPSLSAALNAGDVSIVYAANNALTCNYPYGRYDYYTIEAKGFSFERYTKPENTQLTEEEAIRLASAKIVDSKGKTVSDGLLVNKDQLRAINKSNTSGNFRLSFYSNKYDCYSTEIIVKLKVSHKNVDVDEKEKEEPVDEKKQIYISASTFTVSKPSNRELTLTAKDVIEKAGVKLSDGDISKLKIDEDDLAKINKATKTAKYPLKMSYDDDNMVGSTSINVRVNVTLPVLQETTIEAQDFSLEVKDKDKEYLSASDAIKKAGVVVIDQNGRKVTSLSPNNCHVDEELLEALNRAEKSGDYKLKFTYQGADRTVETTAVCSLILEEDEKEEDYLKAEDFEITVNENADYYLDIETANVLSKLTVCDCEDFSYEIDKSQLAAINAAKESEVFPISWTGYIAGKEVARVTVNVKLIIEPQKVEPSISANDFSIDKKENEDLDLTVKDCRELADAKLVAIDQADDSRIGVDKEQLMAICNAEESGVYPLTFIYIASDMEKTLERTVSVTVNVIADPKEDDDGKEDEDDKKDDDCVIGEIDAHDFVYRKSMGELSYKMALDLAEVSVYDKDGKLMDLDFDDVDVEIDEDQFDAIAAASEGEYDLRFFAENGVEISVKATVLGECDNGTRITAVDFDYDTSKGLLSASKVRNLAGIKAVKDGRSVSSSQIEVDADDLERAALADSGETVGIMLYAPDGSRKIVNVTLENPLKTYLGDLLQILLDLFGDKLVTNN